MKKGKRKIIVIAICMVILFGVLISCIQSMTNVRQISYSEAQQLIQTGQIKSVQMTEESQNIKLYSETETFKTIIPDIKVFSEFMKENNSYEIEFEVLEKKSSYWWILPVLIFLIYIVIINRVSKFFKKIAKTSGESLKEFVAKKDSLDPETIMDKFSEKLMGNEKIEPVNTSDYSFEDVAGIDNERFEIEEVVLMLKDPEKYLNIGAKIPKGILLSGEPGTGKTLIAKAIAGEAGVNFYSCSGSHFDTIYAGAGAQKVRKLFEEAKKNAPAIIFIDEIDSLAKKRYSSANSYHEQTLNQLLNEMDGFNKCDNIIMIAATNHIEVLDPALTRPGRFDRIINIPMPDKKARREILEVHCKGKSFDEYKDQNLDELSKKTANMAGADLENILNEAAIIAVRNNKEYIDKATIDEAFIKVILGISKQDKEISEEDKLLTAIHESGHAIVSRVLRPKLQILDVSIVPRGTAGGYTLFADEENSFPTKEDFIHEIMVLLGGRVAEEAKLGTIDAGASSDLDYAAQIAHQMVYDFAMGEMQLVKIYGEDDYNAMLEEKMFSSVEKIIEDAYSDTLQLINKHEGALDELSQMLIEKSTLSTSELEEVFSRHNI